MVGPSGVTEYRLGNWQASGLVDSSPSQTAIHCGRWRQYLMVSTTRRTTILVTLGATCRSIRSSWTAMRRRGGCTISIQGRWISPDPAGFSAADSSNPQTYGTDMHRCGGFSCSLRYERRFVGGLTSRIL